MSFRTTCFFDRRANFPRATALASLLALGFLPSVRSRAQEARKPLSKQEVIELLTTDLPSSEVEKAARQFGISFRVTAGVEAELRDAGANDALIQALRELAPKGESKSGVESPVSSPASSPPVLNIQSSPGGTQVYVDDEPLATTSPEGRLKLTRLSPGRHAVRLTLAGYRDFEQQVTLISGQTTSLEADLQSAAVKPSTSSVPSNPSPGGRKASATNPVQGTLGCFVRKSLPENPGVVVLATAPGSPAEKAGLLPGFIVSSVAGHEVSDVRDVVSALAGYGPGDAVDIVYSNGAANLTAHPVLAPISLMTSLPRFRVVHDHGPPAPNYCQGELVIVGKTILYFGRQAVSPNGPTDDIHEFDFHAAHIMEVKKNAVYMAAQGAFHIRTKRGVNANFILLGENGKYAPPGPVLLAVSQAFGQ